MTDYNPKYCAEVTKLMAAGLTETEVIAKLGKARSTFYRWKKEFPEFAEALELGRDLYGANMIQLGREGMNKTKDIDYRFWKDLSKNVHELKDPVSTNTGNTNNIQINNYLNEQSNEELLAYIKNQMETHPELTRVIEGEIIDVSE
jgi:hypothetical protein